MSETLADILRSYIPDGDGYNSEYAHNLNAAADALESQQSAPAGYVMVPVEPTEALLDAMWNNVQKDPTDNQLKVLYKAILAAAPKAEQPPAQEPVIDEQAAFEEWIARVCPSGDCESVQRQWEESSEYLDLYAAPQPVSYDAVRGLVEALEVLAKLGNGEHYGNSDGNVIAQMALAAYRAAMGSNGE